MSYGRIYDCYLHLNNTNMNDNANAIVIEQLKWVTRSINTFGILFYTG